MTNNKISKALAGVTLCGYKRKDGIITDFFETPLWVDEFPEVITVLDNTFTRESVSCEGCINHPVKGQFYNAEYV